MSDGNASIARQPTGIAGLDSITGGGLPAGRSTLISGTAGSGKTILALQTLVNAATSGAGPAIFVAFEESPERIIQNAASFGWDLPGLQQKKLFFLDARPGPDLVQSGDSDIQGLLSGLDARITEFGVTSIAFDALDVLLSVIEKPSARRREIHRLNQWLIQRNLTALITAKRGRISADPVVDSLDIMEFMVDCSLNLVHRVEQGISQRLLRVGKFRGSDFEENEHPMVIGPSGIEVAFAPEHDRAVAKVTNERLSSGVERLDTMLGGGYHRGAGILITGAPGTAKTTLSGAFALAACNRNENVLFVSFDSQSEEILRNLRSVSIDLTDCVKRGQLSLISARSIQGSAEIHLMRIRRAAEAHGARCVIVDPVSALGKSGNREYSHSVAERLVDWAKNAGITLLVTSLLGDHEADKLSTPLEVSTIADTWIHLSNMSHSGERNRALSVLKSRGTAHSNQVRELILGDDGVSLADVYLSGGEVLMGALRYQREADEDRQYEQGKLQAQQEQLRLAEETEELETQLAAIQKRLNLRRRKQELVKRAQELHGSRERDLRKGLSRRRSADDDAEEV